MFIKKILPFLVLVFTIWLWGTASPQWHKEKDLLEHYTDGISAPDSRFYLLFHQGLIPQRHIWIEQFSIPNIFVQDMKWAMEEWEDYRQESVSWPNQTEYSLQHCRRLNFTDAKETLERACSVWTEFYYFNKQYFKDTNFTVVYDSICPSILSLDVFNKEKWLLKN